MEDKVLQNLLIRADDALPPPVPAMGLANEVRQISRHRTRQRTLFAAVATTAVFFILLAVSLRPAAPSSVTKIQPAPLKEIKAEIAALDAAALLHERSAKALEGQHSLARRRYTAFDDLSQPDALQRVDEARDRAALLLLREAERQAADSQNTSLARESYRRAARLFPETPAGRVAAEKLALLM